MTQTPWVLAFDEIDSTNAEARRRAEAGERSPLWITAARQTAGRGRRGRTWNTGAGNLAATYLFVSRMAPNEAAQISFVAALAVADLAAAFVPAHLVTVKWPNDILIAGRKVAGILVESGAAPEGGLWIAVGIGVNLVHAPDALPPPALAATALAAHGSGGAPAPREALKVLNEAMTRWRGVWETHGFSAIAAGWTAKAHGLGACCTARLPTETIVGIALGLDGDGALRLKTADGTVCRISAGDVFFS